jgi:hypothetical protein
VRIYGQTIAPPSTLRKELLSKTLPKYVAEMIGRGQVIHLPFFPFRPTMKWQTDLTKLLLFQPFRHDCCDDWQQNENGATI